jgi:phage major head subunit gpT-like protein
MFSVTRQDLINDDLGALTDIPRQIGRGGILKLNSVFWAMFMNNATFFTTNRKNYQAGAGTALASAGLKAANLLFRKQTDSKGKPIGVNPRILLVPPELEVTADELMTSTRNNTGGGSSGSQVPERNTWAGKFQTAQSSYLSINEDAVGYSADAWYLLANPNDLAVIETVFLNGQETPIVESAEALFNVLGIDFRGYFDFGVNLQEYRGGVKMKGKA